MTGALGKEGGKTVTVTPTTPITPTTPTIPVIPAEVVEP